MADGSGLLAIAGEAGSGEGVQRRPIGTAREGGLADPGPAVDGLECPDVDVLAGMRAGEDGDLVGRQLEGLDAACLEQRDRTERLDGRAQRDEPIGVAQDPDEAAGRIGLDDVAAMDALLDPVPQQADQDRRRLSLARAAWRGWSCGDAARVGSGWRSAGDGDTGPRIPRTRRGVATMDPSPRVPTPRRSPCPPRPLHVSSHPAVLHKLAILRDENTEPKKFREIVRELSWLIGYEALAGRPRQAAGDPDPDGADDRASAGRADRAGADPAGRPGHGGRDAGADAHRAGLAPGPLPRRADAHAGRVLQQAARTPRPWTCASSWTRCSRPADRPRPPSRSSRSGARCASSWST